MAGTCAPPYAPVLAPRDQLERWSRLVEHYATITPDDRAVAATTLAALGVALGHAQTAGDALVPVQEQTVRALLGMVDVIAQGRHPSSVTLLRIYAREQVAIVNLALLALELRPRHGEAGHWVS